METCCWGCRTGYRVRVRLMPISSGRASDDYSRLATCEGTVDKSALLVLCGRVQEAINTFLYSDKFYIAISAENFSAATPVSSSLPMLSERTLRWPRLSSRYCLQ